MQASEREEYRAPAPDVEVFVDAAGNERVRALRRRMPFGRGAVLVIGGRTHVVGLADVSVTGAYLTTRAEVAAGESHLLRLLLLPDTSEVELRVEVVRVVQGEHESPEHPRGVAVRFVETQDVVTRKLLAFIRHARTRSAAAGRRADSSAR
jgi:PilZ domain-containing protein